MKSLKKFQFFYLFIAAMMLLCLSVGQAAAALTPEQQTQIEAAVATGDSATIAATIKGIVADAIVNGQDPATIAQQATSIAVTAATCQNMTAVAQAASSGAAAGAVEAAVATGQDVAAVAQEASSGTTAGAVQAVAATPCQTDALIAEVTAAAGTGSSSGATETATNFGLDTEVIAAVTQAAQTGSNQGATQAQELIAGTPTPETPEAFESADETPVTPEAFEPAARGGFGPQNQTRFQPEEPPNYGDTHPGSPV